MRVIRAKIKQPFKQNSGMPPSEFISDDLKSDEPDVIRRYQNYQKISQELAEGRSDLSAEDIFHAFVLLEQDPLTRLNRALRRGRALGASKHGK